MEAAAGDERPNLHSKLQGQRNSRKITRTCVPVMVARIGYHWDAASKKHLVLPIIQHMVVLNNIGGIESHDEYEVLRENRPHAELTLIQAHQETNNLGAKAFRDRARELVMPFFVHGDPDPESNEQILQVKHSIFSGTGKPVLHQLLRVAVVRRIQAGPGDDLGHR